MALTCPHCGHDKLKTTDSRRESGNSVGRYRRRECRQCKERFSTSEVVVSEAEGLISKSITMRTYSLGQRLDRATTSMEHYKQQIREMKAICADIEKEHSRIMGAHHRTEAQSE